MELMLIELEARSFLTRGKRDRDFGALHYALSYAKTLQNRGWPNASRLVSECESAIRVAARTAPDAEADTTAEQV